MRTLAAIRTNKWGEDEERVLGQLRPAFGDDLVVVFHDRPADLGLPLAVVDLTRGWVARQGLGIVPDWGWRCGDYAHYAARAAFPGFDHYWLIEPDVFFTSDPAPFFARFDAVTTDALGFRYGPFERDFRFTRALGGIEVWRAMFPLTRFSGRALDHLAEMRRKLAAQGIGARTWPNDEVFCFSYVRAHPELAAGALEDVAPDWFEAGRFATDPDILHDLAVAQAVPGKVMHPVRSRAWFCRALAGRLTGRTAFLAPMRESLALLTDAEIDAAAESVAGTVAGLLRRFRAAGSEGPGGGR
ncbi:MAG: component of SufBCD complex [Pseudomonadota bacterium]